jgi:adenine-specific DNA-methyltransferase
MPSIQFKGKTYVQNHHLSVKFHQLVPEKEKSLTDKVSLHDNLVIEGDNLLALKALLPIYAGKVKCIYIDPPYNTGNENWVYNDNVNSPMMQEWLGSVVDRDDLTRHDKWLCMMMPRLKLLKELLSEDGAIFISIDDNEQHRLRMLLDEIFGDDNFVGNVIWEKADSPKMDADTFSTSHDHILIYAKRISDFKVNKLELTEDELKHYTKTDPKGRVYYLKPLRAMGGQGDSREARPTLYYPMVSPEGKEVYPIRQDGTDGAWRWSKGKVAKESDRIEWVQGKNGWVPYFRIYADTSEGRPPMTIWFNQQVGSNRTSKKEVNEILETDNSFGTPKPVALMEYIIGICCDSESVVLDGFAGSATTAHAVLNQNLNDNGNRRFIAVELEDYADTITAERVRRVIKGVPESKNFKEGTGGTFSYFRLGDPVEMERILHGDALPTYEELARYVYFTATGEEFDPKQITGDKKRPFIGESKDYEVFLFYVPEVSYLMNTALTLDMARSLGPYKEKKRLVFAPMKYLDQDYLDQLRMEYSQLPFEIYRFKE